MNLFIGKIFKESDKFKQALIKAIKIAFFFKSTNHKRNIFKLLLTMIQDGIIIMSVFVLYSNQKEHCGYVYSILLLSKCNNMEKEYNILI
jgi:hypothetical protein